MRNIKLPKFNKFKLLFIVLIIAIPVAMMISFSDGLETEFADNIIEPLPQVIRAPQMKNYYSFAGERIPIESFDVMERLDRELLNNSYSHSLTLQSMKLSYRYFPVISPILEQYGIPEDFKYMAVAESGLRNVISSANATGYWQIMKPTAIELQMIINEDIDERYDIERSTIAAAQYLLKLKKRFGSWINVIAAYNIGMTKFSKNMVSQEENDFYDMNMNSETMRYLFRLVAIKELFENPGDYGFHINHTEKYGQLDDYYTIKVDSSVSSLGKFAHDNNTTFRLLKLYNPWLISDKLTVKDTSFFIKIKK
ncbi:MAG: lytic transglycosylase domain-containing protein [Deltaproteobacteria bacterium]